MSISVGAGAGAAGAAQGHVRRAPVPPQRLNQ